MGERGFAAKPTHLRVLEGNPGKRPFNPVEAKVPLVKKLPVPEYFDAERRRIWNEVCDELANMNGLSSVDYQMILLYVDSVADCQRLIKKMIELQDSIVPVIGKDGKPRGVKTSPYFSQLIAQKTVALRFANHFGMTPSARARIVFLGNAGGENDRVKDPFGD